MLRSAQQLEKDGSLQKAVAKYQDFLKAYPDHTQVTDASYRLAKCFEEQGMPEEETAALKAVLASTKKSFRNRPDAFYMLGKLYASNKDYDNALATFEKMLSEGAGLYEDEVLNLTGGYYAIQQKFEEAAGKFNLLKRRRDSALAEQAAYKLAVLWLKAGKMDLAIDAVQDLAQGWPNNQQIPELLLRAADSYRSRQSFDKTVAICQELKNRYPRSPEALASGYMLGLVYRDQKEFKKAAEALDQAAGAKDVATKSIAAEATLASADIYFAELKDLPKAMLRYEHAAQLARDCDSDRRSEILEQCYFHLGEYYFAQKKYSIALEQYLLLRNLGTKINILGRILDCQAQLKSANPSEVVTEADVTIIAKRIKENPGTAAALEGEVFLLDRKLSDALHNRGTSPPIGAEYEKLLTAYSKDILETDFLGLYILGQIGTAYANSATREDQTKAANAFDKLVAADPEDKSGYRVAALEGLALAAERAGDKARAAKAYDQLFAITKTKLDAAKDDKALEKRAMDYLRTIVTRADSDDLVDKSIELCRKTIDEKGALSDLSKESRYYMAELYYLKKDYSAAAKTYREFIQIYGPKQDDKGDIAGGAWKPASVDENAARLYEAAIRVANCWYMQHNDGELKKAYEWIVRNFPTGNKYMAEAQYWLAMELSKGQAGQTKENKREQADALWTKVVNPSQNFDDVKFRNSFYPWASLPEEDPSHAVGYVKSAILRAGQVYGEIGEHELAARMFEQYIAMFGGREGRAGADEMLANARYALGREYIALDRIARMVKLYKAYITASRADRFRISALKLLGYHAGKAKMFDDAIEAYATLLDEYGPVVLDEQGRPIPVPVKDRLRPTHTWDGIRTPPPADLNLGEIRYALGFLCWKQEQFPRCAQVLAPFLDDPKLADNKFRALSLFMAGQSCYRNYDWAAGAKLLRKLIRDYPKFEASEEAYEYTAQGLLLTQQWDELAIIYKTFVAEWPNSGRRPRMDLYHAVGLVNKGKTDDGLKELKALIDGDADQATKADALYHDALIRFSGNDVGAFEELEKSVSLYPRETSCLAAAKCAMRVKNWKRAQELLDRTLREFPQGDPGAIAEARSVLPSVLKEIAKQK